MIKQCLYPNARELVTVLGDHDVKRFVSEPGATPESLKLAFTFLLPARGIPLIYYGDEIGMTRTIRITGTTSREDGGRFTQRP